MLTQVNAHEIYVSPTSNDSKVSAKVQVFRYVGQRSQSSSLVQKKGIVSLQRMYIWNKQYIYIV